MADGMIHTQNFYAFEWATGKIADCDPNFPTTLYAWDAAELSLNQADTAFFGFVQEGEATLATDAGSFTLKAGMYFSANNALRITGGKGIIMARSGHQAFFLIGGPVESKGRLKYIDGCTDSLLVSPIRMGDPCTICCISRRVLIRPPTPTRQTVLAWCFPGAANVKRQRALSRSSRASCSVFPMRGITNSAPSIARCA